MIEECSHMGFKILCSLYGLFSIRYMINDMEYKQLRFQYIQKKYESSQKLLQSSVKKLE